MMDDRLAAALVPSDRWYNRASDPPETTMSADKHRAIRRQKQKRAKDSKKRAQHRPAVVQPGASDSAAQPKSE
jgi:hypothetical protein